MLSACITPQEYFHLYTPFRSLEIRAFDIVVRRPFGVAVGSTLGVLLLVSFTLTPLLYWRIWGTL